MCPPESVNRCRTSARARTWATRCPPCFGRSIIGYPIRPMPLFRRRDQRPPPRATEPPRPRVEDEDTDWRSFDPLAGAYARLSAPDLARGGGDLVELLQ